MKTVSFWGRREIIESRRRAPASPHEVRDILEIFHGVFKKCGVKHVSLYRLKDGILKIDRAEVYPPEPDDAFYVDLSPGEGVAGRVFADLKTRYMPRMTIGGRLFPHAVVFEWQTIPEGCDPHPTFEISDLDFEMDVYKPPESYKVPYRSFLSVPLKSTRKNGCEGVLNVDFDKKDSLDKRGVVMAMVIGLILADEI